MDASDAQVYDTAASEGEFAISGSFTFAHLAEQQLTGKVKQAFANGFLGLPSFGRSTFVAVAKISTVEFEDVVDQLAGHFVDQYGAPSKQAATDAARAEAEFAAGLCEHPVNTLLCVQREWTTEGIRESFRVVEPWREGMHAKVWSIVDDDEEQLDSREGTT